MTDAHCHCRGEEGERCFVCSPSTGGTQPGDLRFVGFHPWYLDDFDLDALRRQLQADPALGVGEIGLDRLRERTISPKMREAFESQLVLAEEFRRPVALHGAKCWGEVVAALRRHRVPASIFHGFSRSDGLLPDIFALNGYVSVGPAILNDHAVNYREMVRKIPLDRLLVETDRTEERRAETPALSSIVTRLAEIRGISLSDLSAALDDNIAHLTAGIVV